MPAAVRAFAMLLVAAALSPAFAHDVAKPQGPVILEVTGAISHQNDAAGFLFDQAMIEALPSTTFATSTPWTEGIVTFTGASAGALSEDIGFSGRTAVASALDDYVFEIPLAALVERGAILAYRMNGGPLPAQFAPLWIVFPFDTDPAVLTE